MKQFKYIIVKKLGHEVAILFDPLLDHAEVDQSIPVISAGFCQIFTYRNEEGHNACVNVHVFGESTTLKKESRPEDIKIILRNIDNEIH